MNPIDDSAYVRARNYEIREGHAELDRAEGRSAQPRQLITREQVEAIPRYILMLQPSEGWTKERGHTREPVAHEAIKLADVLALFDDEA